MELLIILILTFVALGGLAGGVAMMVRPDGSLIGMSTDLLKRTPVRTYFWPGVFLITCMSIWPGVLALGLAFDAVWARGSIVVFGAALVVWIGYQLYALRTFSPFQPIMLIAGLALVVFSLLFL